jgi:hypothetical protein
MMIRARVVSAAALTLAVLAGVAATELAAQDLHPSRRPSPLGMSRILLGDTYVKVTYGQPYKRGRENIFGTKESGALVPFGEIWRTGANESSELTITKNLTIAGKPLAAGTYSLFTTPGEKSWKIHFNSLLGLDGTGHFDAATEKFTPADLPPHDVLVVEVPPVTLPEDKEVDQFTISFEKGAAGADMVLRWIRTEVRVPLAAAK